MSMNKSKVLYISDLDGTLLNANETLSAYTALSLNALIEQGLLFTYATARSFVTSSKVTNKIDFKIPVIIYNGTFIYDSVSDKILLSNSFTDDESTLITDLLLSSGIFPIVYSFINGTEKFTYYEKSISRGLQAFLNSRKDDARRNPSMHIDALLNGDIFHFTCIDDYYRLLPVYDKLKHIFSCVIYKDIYTGEYWLEIMPQKASKANAVMQLKKMLCCDKVIAFGDNNNDISMFESADECYAVENACKELKEYATSVILSNENDGVAK